MGKLFFYSDQTEQIKGNQRLDKILLSEWGDKDIKIGYIPSTEDRNRTYFNTKVRYYRNYGIKDFLYFDLYSEFDSSKINELLKCDIIHFSAGDPINFRNAIHKRNMKNTLCDYYHQGGIIVGVSGGAVQFGNSTKLFQLFIGDTKEELETLKLVNFDFFPHYNRWNEEYKKEIYQYAKKSAITIYAANDGDGVIFKDNKIQLIGDIVLING